MKRFSTSLEVRKMHIKVTLKRVARIKTLNNTKGWGRCVEIGREEMTLLGRVLMGTTILENNLTFLEKAEHKPYKPAICQVQKL